MSRSGEKALSTVMPKTEPRVATPDLAPIGLPNVASRPCPRCREPLQHERSYIARGLTGLASTEARYRCPACDARFHYSSVTARWRELTEEA